MGTALTPAEQRAERKRMVLEARAKGVVAEASGKRVFIKFNGNTGALTTGRPPTPIPADQEFGVLMDMIQVGIVKWQNGQPVERRLVPMLGGTKPTIPEGEPTVGSLPKPNDRDGWQDNTVLTLVGRGGDFDGIEVEFACASQGERQMVADLCAAMFARAEADEPLDGALIVLSADSYEHKAYKRTVYVPVATVVAWTDGITVERVDEEDADVLG